MPFSVQDFQDLLRLLDEHPEWQAELRRRLLTDELLELPALVRRIAEGQLRTDEQLATLTAQVQKLALAQLQTDATVKAQIARLDAAIDELVEWRYERRAGTYFSDLARGIRLMDCSTLADLLEDAVEDGRIARGDRQDVLHADLVLTGRRREDSADVYIVAEISVGIGVDDVRRAADRAAVMAKLGRPAVAVVAGDRIDPEPAELASALGVLPVLDRNAALTGETA